MLALTVRTYYMPNDDWQAICRRSRTLREGTGTLTGHGAGEDTAPVLDQAAAVRVLGAGHDGGPDWRRAELPEPLASVAEYLADDLDPDQGREFVPTAELVDALEVDPIAFARQMTELGCRPTRGRVPTEDGDLRRVRGHLTAEIRAAIERVPIDENGSPMVDHDCRPIR